MMLDITLFCIIESFKKKGKTVLPLQVKHPQICKIHTVSLSFGSYMEIV